MLTTARLKTNQGGQCFHLDNETKTAVEAWKREAEENPAGFLESQIGKKLEKFDRADWRDVRVHGLRFLPMKIRKLITSQQGRKSYAFYAALRTANQASKKLSIEESLDLVEHLYRNRYNDLTYKQYMGLKSNTDLLARLHPTALKMIANSLSSTKRPAKEGVNVPFMFLKTLPSKATPERIDKALLALPKYGKLGRMEDGRVVFPENVWKYLRWHRSELPENVRDRYRTELGYVKRGRKPRSKTPEEQSELSMKLKEKQERQNKKRIEVRRKEHKPKTKLIVTRKPVKTEKPNEALDDRFDELDDDALFSKPKSVPMVDHGGLLRTENDVIKFINDKANDALLEGEFRRSRTYPVQQWTTPDWALVNVFRDRIYPAFLEEHREKINSALRKLGMTVGASVGTIRGYDMDLMLSTIALYRAFSTANIA